MNTKKEYIAPTLTVVTFKVEQGFAASSVFHFQLFNEDNSDNYNSQAQENWHESSNFGTDW